MKSFSVVANDDDGNPLDLIYVNCKNATLTISAEALAVIVKMDDTNKPDLLFSNNWRDAISQKVAEAK